MAIAMHSKPPPLIHEAGHLDQASHALMDHLWSQGWRHFGSDFFRYSVMLGDEDEIQFIQPLRMPLADFSPSKSQRRVLRRNLDVEIRMVPARVDAEREELFLRHRERFVSNIPDSLHNFIPSTTPDRSPCECRCVEVWHSGRLIAVSYMDVGEEAVSSVYAMFDPEEAHRSLGTLTLLEEIRWAQDHGKRWLYPGYATEQSSAYDYKKSFRPLERFDWQGNWVPLV